MAKKFRDIPSHAKKFDTLYHGTIIENAAKICKEGIKKGSIDRVGDISWNDPLDPDGRVADCLNMVSMSKNQKDAIFFACAWRRKPKNERGQAIFEVDASKLDKNKMYFRKMFGKEWAEVKYLDDIPPDAIKRVFLREFDWSDDLKVKEEYKTCQEVLHD